jgi:hypothetical protein
VKGKRNEFTHAVWTLPAGGTTPTAVETAKTYTRVTKKTSRVKGKLHTVTTYESCGPSVELAGLSDAHQLLLYRSSYNCLPNGHSSETTSGAIHNLDTGAEIPSKAVRESVYATIQDNLLITSEWDDVVIRDLATNAFRKFKLDDLVWQVAVAPSGEVITVSDAHKAGDRISRISIFAPGTTTNPIKLDSAWLSAPTVELCAGGFVELREKRGEKMRIVLHSMTGAIEAVLAGPRSGLGYDTSCTGRHLTLAATANAGPPQVFNYDL